MSKYLMIQGSGSSFEDNAIEQVQISVSEVEIAPSSTIQSLMVNPETGVVESQSSQQGFIYGVEAGDVIHVYCTKDSDGTAAQFRYGIFASSSISAGSQASQYGQNISGGAAHSPITVTVNTSGYLMVTSIKPSVAIVTIKVKKLIQ